MTCEHLTVIRSREIPRTLVLRGMVAGRYGYPDDYWQCIRCGEEWHPDLDYSARTPGGESVTPAYQKAVTAVDRAYMAAHPIS